MKQVAITKMGNPSTGEKGEFGVIDYPIPEIGPEDVLIKVAFCAICGSDPHAAAGNLPIPVPFPLGHEVSGTIVQLGEKATRKELEIGDRVAGNYAHFCGTCYYCRNGQEQFCEAMMEWKMGGMAEYVVWHESQVYKIPDSISFEEASLLEPVSIALRAVERADIRPGARVAVSGGGGIGLLAAQLARICGASSVTVIEPIEEKRNLAKSLGIDHVIDPFTKNVQREALSLTDGIGFDSVIESSGAPAAVKSILGTLAKGGTAVCFAMYPADFELPFNLYANTYFKEITVRGFFMSPYSFPRAVLFLPRLNLKALIQKVYSIDEAAEAFKAQMSGKYAKVLIKCSK
jgi:(R,R)-butanediol dehydrogenase/meso-butanediol dehydrogenase/diacetyl reductase/L-iditol 2-dehydrogenase